MIASARGKEGKKGAAMPASQVTLIGRLEMAFVCVCKKNLFICRAPTLRQQVGPLFVPSFACQPTTTPPHPPSSYSPIIVCLSLHLFWLFMAEWGTDGRGRRGRTPEARECPGRSIFQRQQQLVLEMNLAHLMSPSHLPRIPCVNIPALMIKGATIYHVHFWTSCLLLSSMHPNIV